MKLRLKNMISTGLSAIIVLLAWSNLNAMTFPQYITAWNQYEKSVNSSAPNATLLQPILSDLQTVAAPNAGALRFLAGKLLLLKTADKSSVIAALQAKIGSAVPMSAPAASPASTSAVVPPAAPIVSPVSGGGSGSVSGRSVRTSSDGDVASVGDAKSEIGSTQTSVREKDTLTPFNINFYKTDIENLANLYQDYDIAIQAFNTEQSSGWGSIFGKSAKEKLADLQSEHELKINAAETRLKQQLAASEDMQVKRMQKIYKQILKEYYGVENNEKDISKILAKPGAKKIVTDKLNSKKSVAV